MSAAHHCSLAPNESAPSNETAKGEKNDKRKWIHQREVSINEKCTFENINIRRFAGNNPSHIMVFFMVARMTLSEDHLPSSPQIHSGINHHIPFR
jgi:hypothetical protein